MKRSLFACHLGVLLLAGILAPPLQADTITFSDVDRSPSNPLVIGDVTISSGLWGDGLPATVSDVGLGSALLGSFGVVDRIERYNGSSPSSEAMRISMVRESLSLSMVNGTIDSVTIVPYFTVLEGAPVQLPFEILSNEFYFTLDPTNPNPLTIPYFHRTGFSLGVVGDFGEEPHFRQYLSDNGYPDVTFDYGFTVLSMDYTPNNVPDPGSSLLLLGTGLVGLRAWRTRWQ
jgi:hypothetical protein